MAGVAYQAVPLFETNALSLPLVELAIPLLRPFFRAVSLPNLILYSGNPIPEACVQSPHF